MTDPTSAEKHFKTSISDTTINTVLIRCMAMHSLMAASWVGQNSGPIFHCLWTKVHQINFACAGVSVVCNAIFWLTTSCCIPEIFVIKSQSCPKSRQKFYFGFFGGCQISGGVIQISDQILQSGSPSNMWQSLVTIGQTTSDIRRRKEKDLKPTWQLRFDYDTTSV